MQGHRCRQQTPGQKSRHPASFKEYGCHKSRSRPKQKIMTRPTLAHVLPFAVFAGFLLLPDVAGPLLGGISPVLGEHPKLLLWPLQTVLCAVALVVFWKSYPIGRPQNPLLAISVGVLAFVIWVAPAFLPGAVPRVDGFDPSVVESDPAAYWLTLAARFTRLVIVVPLVEEIFWRSFVMRYLIDQDWEKVAFGTYRHLSFWAVTGLFVLAHNMPDWSAAVAVGALFGWVTVKTKSLTSVVLAHAVTNLLLGIYIVATRQWGFW